MTILCQDSKDHQIIIEPIKLQIKPMLVKDIEILTHKANF